MNSLYKGYTLSLVLSCVCHGLAFGGMSWYRMVTVSPVLHPDPVVLQLVDMSVSVPEEKVSDTAYIASHTSRAKDRAPGGEDRGSTPQSEGDTAILNLEKSVVSVPSETRMLQDEVQAKELLKELERLTAMKEQLLQEKHKLDEHVSVQHAELERMEKSVRAQRAQNAQLEEAERKRLYERMESEVQELGDASFAARSHEIVPYLKKLRRQIFDQWFPLIGFKAGIMPDSRAVVCFTIREDGSLGAVEIRSQQGAASFGPLCVASIRAAAPFDRVPIEFPDYLREKVLTITFTFYYD